MLLLCSLCIIKSHGQMSELAIVRFTMTNQRCIRTQHVYQKTMYMHLAVHADLTDTWAAAQQVLHYRISGMKN